MTKEEYERLLKSDYWKGYSYSLIKERNFTCEDCGRRFYGERNKLQVHHLVYRDVNPWSYSPDEVVVLCEDCHKKRHGIATEDETEQNTSYAQSPFGEYDKGYSFSNDSNEERAFSTMNEGPHNTENRSPYNIEPEPSRGFKFKYIIYGILLFLCIMIGRDMLFKQKPFTNDRPSYENKEITVEGEDTGVSAQSEEAPLEADRPSRLKGENKSTGNSTSKTSADEDVLPVEVEPVATTKSTRTESASVEPNDEVEQETPKRELSTLEILERRNHEDVVRRAKRAGVSTEGTTIEILERINHADVVKRAQRAGVSTEGTTIEILERINHADVVKRAQRAGVSTEGSTIDILERINHADVVKRAKRLGVSTEGSTIDILERINRKEMEKYNY